MIIAVDFDGTLCKNRYPYAGAPNEPLIDTLKYYQKEKGAELILWTCRTDDELKFAVDWCEKQGLIFDEINENLPRIVEKYGKGNRKIFADVYIDDCAVDFGYSIFEQGLLDCVGDKEMEDFLSRCIAFRWRNVLEIKEEFVNAREAAINRS